MKVQIFKDRTKQWRVRFVARNGRKLMVSEAYKTIASARKCLKAVRNGAGNMYSPVVL